MIAAFIGPSISPAEARAVDPSIVVRPPVGRGDLIAELRDFRTRILVIIDGVFTHQLAVSPSELRLAVEAGATVIGAASMGALRAAECWPLGVVGVGEIYEAYRHGQLDCDDEVAVITNPDENYRAMSLPLVQVRYATTQIQRAGLIDSRQAEALVRAAASLFFARRCWAAVFQGCETAIEQRTREALCAVPDLKRADAVAALRYAVQVMGVCDEATKIDQRRLVPPPSRYSGYDRFFGRSLEQTAERLTRWLFGSGRYQPYVWNLVAGEAELAGLAELDGDARAVESRTRLGRAVARLLREDIGLPRRLLSELDFLGELEAELCFLEAIERLAAEKALAAHPLRWARERVAVEHGFREWIALAQEVEGDRLFGAIPMLWVEEAVRKMAGAHAELNARAESAPSS